MNVAATDLQFNTAPVDYSYRAPVEFFGTFDKTTGKRNKGKLGTFAQLKVLIDIFTFSVFKDGKTGVCTRSYDLFKRDVNVSESTARRALESFKELIKSEAKGKYQFNTENLQLSGGHYRLEAWMTRPIIHNDSVITFSTAEQMVVGYFNSECNRAPVELSAQDIANVLDMSVPIVQKAINKLTAGQKDNPFVYCVQKGVNGYKKSKYIINRTLFRELNKAEKRRQKAIEQEQKTEVKKEPKHRSEGLREALDREYYERKHKREEAAQRTLTRAMADESFRTSDEALKRLAPRFAFAKLKNRPDYEKLKLEYIEITERRHTALKRLCIDEAELSEEFYIQCLKCRDKLFLSGGKICNCFNSGSPPGNAD